MLKLVIVFIFLSVYTNLLYSQQLDDNTRKANELYQNAIQSTNTGKFDVAIAQCDSAIMLNSKPIAYPYEKALALYKKYKFDDAVKILDSLKNHLEVNPQVYQLLGNCYDAMNDNEKAIETYNNGLTKFPKSGRLYFEIGLQYMAQKEIRGALSYWENGIYAEPRYPNNYFILSQHYYKVGFSVWAVIYGEIFTNITDNDYKLKEMSNLLFDFYKKSFYHLEDSVLTIQFTTSTILTTVKIPNKDLSFDMAYQSVMRDAAKDILPVDSMNFSINILYQIRKRFIEQWYREELDKTFPNVLFDWHKKLIDENIFEAYNYFLFSEASIEETKDWLIKNQLKGRRFQTLIPDNLLNIDEKHFWYKSQY